MLRDQPKPPLGGRGNWMGERRSAACTSKTQVLFTVDWIQTLLKIVDCISITGFPQFSCALVQMRYTIGENGCGHILKGETLAGKKEIEKGMRIYIYI